MKLNYSHFCFDGNIEIDGKKIQLSEILEHKELVINAIKKMFDNFLQDEENLTELFKMLISFKGEFEETNACGQCGNLDEIINLEI